MQWSCATSNLVFKVLKSPKDRLWSSKIAHNSIWYILQSRTIKVYPLKIRKTNPTRSWHVSVHKQLKENLEPIRYNQAHYRSTLNINISYQSCLKVHGLIVIKGAPRPKAQAGASFVL